MTATDTLQGEDPEVLERLNTAYGDAVWFVARILGELPASSAAEVVAVDASGLNLVASTPSGAVPVRIPFLDRIEHVDQVSAAAFALIALARERSGEAGTTSAERDMLGLAATRTFATRVGAVVDVTPELRQVTLAGEDLVRFEPLGPDSFVYVLLPPPGRDQLTVDGGFTWQQYQQMPEPERPVGAYYTVRAWRPDVAELDLQFALHDPAGPATAWVHDVRPGMPVAVWGPRDGFAPPPDTDWYLLVADDTGLPAVAAILDHLDDDVPVTVVAEVDRATTRPPLPVRENLEVVWVHRDGAPPGTVASQVAEALEALPIPDGGGYVWCGAETATVRAVRRHARSSLALRGDRIGLTPYWRRAAS